MKKKITPSMKQRRAVIVSAIRKFWDSADSHLPYTLEPQKDYDRVWEVDTVVEYLEEMLKLAKTLK